MINVFLLRLHCISALAFKADTLNFLCKERKYKQNMCLHLHFCTMGPSLLHIGFSLKKFVESTLKTRCTHEYFLQPKEKIGGVIGGFW